MLFHKTMDRKDEIFLFICEFRSLKGYAPSLRDIVAGTSVASTSTVHRYLMKLEEDGLIRRARDTARSIVPLDGHGTALFFGRDVTLVHKGREVRASHDIGEASGNRRKGGDG